MATPADRDKQKHQFVRLGYKTVRLSVGRGYSTEDHIRVNDIVSMKLQMSEIPSQDAHVIICVVRKDDNVIAQHYLEYNVATVLKIPISYTTITHECPHYDELLRVVNMLLLL